MFKRVLDRYQEAAYAMLRVVAGLMFAVHGLPKLFGVLTTRGAAEIGTQAWIGGVIELACGVAIALGLFTRVAAFLASGTMAVAYIQFHWKFELDDRALPLVNGGELAVVYCFLFLFIATRGGGPYSLDARRRG